MSLLSAPKNIFIGSVALFALIGGIALVKKGFSSKGDQTPVAKENLISSQEKEPQLKEAAERISELLKPIKDRVASEEVDQVWRLFAFGKEKSPIVETVRYKSRVPWLKGRSAWIADYAAHYATSRHFIARSLNGRPDYENQKVSPGDQFNVFNPDRNLNFYLLVDLSRCKMWLYYCDPDRKESELLKTYKVGLGRLDPSSDFASLTPKGQFLLGNKVAIFKPGSKGYFQGEEVEMVRVFGTRWLPFAEEISGEGGDPRGYGFHGAPWLVDEETKSYKESFETVERYESDGCIRLKQDDIEELYSIVITKPTVVEIVTDYSQAKLIKKD